ncbi:MFS transporter [Sphingomonas oligophenolica]
MIEDRSTHKNIAGSGATTTTAALNVAFLLLFLSNAANMIDRQIVNILAEPIKHELLLADWQLGVLTGLTFAVFYTVLGVPLARYADRPKSNRSHLIAGCLALWSAMTALCGLTSGFWQLLAARVGVAVGEAGCSPASHSLITDLVPPERRASALGLYSVGIPVGKLLGLVVGGIIAQALGWRAAFFIVGLPGVLLAVVTWFALPEPRLTRPLQTHSNNFGNALKRLLPIRTFWLASLGAAFIAFLTYGQTAFLGSFLIRVHHVNVGQAGMMLGLAIGGGGAIGTWVGGRVADIGARRDERAYMVIPAIGGGLSAIIFIGSVLTDNLALSVALLTLASAVSSLWYGPMFAAIQGIVPPVHRATAAAIHLLVMNLIGLGLGPLAFGILSDGFNHGFAIAGLRFDGIGPAAGIRYALAVGAGSGVVAAIFLLVACLSIRRDFAAASQAV